MCKVSIIVPVYNVEKFIERTVKSILSQSYSDWEMLLIDDGSTDSSGEICNKLASECEKIKVIHKPNGGLSSARNEGLCHAKGEIICFLDSDDYVSKDYLECIVHQMKDNDLIYFNAKRVDEAGQFLYDIKYKTDSYNLLDNKARFEYIIGVLVNYINGWEVCFRAFLRSVIDEAKLRFESERQVFAEDFLFTLSYVMHCKKIQGVDRQIYYYTRRENSLMESSVNDQASRILRLPAFGKKVAAAADNAANKYISDNISLIYYLIYEWHMKEFCRNNSESAGRQLDDKMMEDEFHAACMKKYEDNYRDYIDSYGKMCAYTSVIVAVYNIEDYIDKCIRSIVSQSSTRIQIILVDDGSTDASGKICDEWAKMDYRISVIHKRNGGLSSARNAGIAKSLGKYIYFVDGDDYIDRQLITVAVGAMLREGCDICTFRARKISGDNEEKFGEDYEYGLREIGNDTDKYRFLYEDFFLYRIGWEAWKNIYLADIIKEYKLEFVSEREVFAEDMLFTSCYMLHARSVLCITDVLYNYVFRENSLMDAKKDKIMIVEFNTIAYYIYNELIKCNLDYCKEHFYRLYERIMFWHVAYLMWNVDISSMKDGIDKIRQTDICLDNIKLLDARKEESIQTYGYEEYLRNHAFIRYVLDNDEKEYEKNFNKMLRYRSRSMLKNKVFGKLSAIRRKIKRWTS